MKYVRQLAAASGLVFLAAMVSGYPRNFGLRTELGKWAKMCEDQRTYIAAFERQDTAAMYAAAQLIHQNIAMFEDSPSMKEWFTGVADAAAQGDPTLVRQNLAVNCQTGEATSP